MPDLQLTTSLPVLALVLAAFAAVALGWLAYRYTIPPVSGLLRSTLTVLRTSGLFLLFLLLGAPILSFISHRIEKPALVVLIDQSKSMTIHDKNGDRKQLVLETLRSRGLRDLESTTNEVFGVFDTRLHMLQSYSSDSVSFAGDGTDIGSALKQIRDVTAGKNVQAILLISDGNATSGPGPLYEAEGTGLPVFTVGVGDTSEPHDVLVRRILANTITYVGNKVPVSATLKSSGLRNERVEATLMEGGKTLDRKTITLEPGTREYEVPFSFVPDVEGRKRLTVEVSQIPGEISFENNRSSTYVNVLRSKMRVILVAGGPGADVAAIRRALGEDANIEVSPYIERGNGQFYEGVLTDQALSAGDCVVMVGYPCSTSSTNVVAMIGRAVSAGKGVMFVLSRTTDFQKLQTLESSLPFTVPRGQGEETEAFFDVADGQGSSPILNVASQPTVWTKLPPLFTLDEPFHAKPESDILAVERIQSMRTNSPFLLSRRVNRSKSLALLCYGVWRWQSYAEGIPGAERLLPNLFSASVRWLVTREDEEPVQVHPVKDQFAGTDPAEFSAQVYDENYRPVDDAEVSLTVTRKGQSSQLTLTPLGNGRFDGAFDPLPEGEYTYFATARVGGREIEAGRGSFSVGGLNTEFQETRANKLLLQQIAARTGGRYYDAGSLDHLPKDFAALPGYRVREVQTAQQWELWNKPWMFALLAGIFSVEWFLRKRSGML